MTAIRVDELQTIVTMGTVAARKEDLRPVIEALLASLKREQLLFVLMESFARINHAEHVLGVLLECEAAATKRAARLAGRSGKTGWWTEAATPLAPDLEQN